MLALTAATVVASVCAVGSVHFTALAWVTPLVIAAALVVLAQREGALPLATLACLALAYYSLAQALPLPHAWLEGLSPRAADIWQRAQHVLGPEASRHSLSLAPKSSVTEGLKWTAYAAAVLCGATLRRWFGTKLVPAIVGASGVLVAFITLVHGLLGSNKLYGIYEPTFDTIRFGLGPLLNPNNLAGYLNLALLSGLGLLLAAGRRTRLALACAVVPMIAVSLLTASRAGVLCAALGVAALLLLSRRERRESHGRRRRTSNASSVYAIGACGLLLAAFAASRGTYAELFESSTSKLDVLSWSGKVVSDFPWTGVGRGAFQSVSPAYRGAIGQSSQQFAENFVLQWMAEWGVVVSLLALVAFGLSLRRRAGTTQDLPTLGLGIGLVVLLLHNLVDVALEVPGVALTASVALGHLAEDARPRFELSSPPLRGALALALVVPFGALLVFGGPGIEGERRSLWRQQEAATTLEATRQAHDSARTALARYPADPYIAYVAGATARRLRLPTALPLLGLALERDPNSGATHLGVAHYMAQKRATGQTLLHVRHAAEHDASLGRAAARLATRATRDPRLLLQAVPEGPSAAPVVSELVRLAPAGADALLARGLETSPDDVQLNRLAAERIAGAIETRAEPCSEAKRAACLATARAHLSTLRRVGAPTFDLVQIEATLLAATDGPSAALARVTAHCSEQPTAECWREACVRADKARDVDVLATAGHAYLASACWSSNTCEAAANWLGALHLAAGRPLVALEYFSRAVRERPSRANWDALATAAERSGQQNRAASARARALSAPP